MLWKVFKIRSFEMGLYFREGEFRGLLEPGRHWFFDPLGRVRVEIVSQRDPWLVHEQLDLIIKSGALQNRAIVLDLADHERALVWIDNRFSHILPAGRYVYWTGQREVRVELVDARNVRFEHAEFKVIARSTMAESVLDVCTVQRPAKSALTDGSFSVGTATPATFPQTLNPGDTSQININFTPGADQTYDPLTNTLTMQTNDPVTGECGGGFPPGNNPNGCKKFLLSGSGGTARVSAFPDQVDFGLVTVGCNSVVKVVRIYNSGRTTVNLTNIYIDPTTAPFDLLQAPSLPLALAAGASTDVQVRYHPPDVQSHTALLVVENDAQNLAVPLSGQGTSTGHQQDSFHQPDRPMSDILWVVDNSGSMSDKQQLLSNNAPRFMQVVQSQSVDYHIAVVTTQYSPTTATADSSSSFQGSTIEAGVFFGTPKQILPTDADPLHEFERSVVAHQCMADVAHGTTCLGPDHGRRVGIVALADVGEWVAVHVLLGGGHLANLLPPLSEAAVRHADGRVRRSTSPRGRPPALPREGARPDTAVARTRAPPPSRRCRRQRRDRSRATARARLWRHGVGHPRLPDDD